MLRPQGEQGLLREAWLPLAPHLKMQGGQSSSTLPALAGPEEYSLSPVNRRKLVAVLTVDLRALSQERKVC